MRGLTTPVLNFEMYILAFKEYSMENGVEEEVDNKLRVGKPAKYIQTYDHS